MALTIGSSEFIQDIKFNSITSSIFVPVGGCHNYHNASFSKAAVINLKLS